ncbi:hypothetical protein BKA70DRAFT_1530440 [Coprinopsis sp. MPI-PUGE-AT-0042]|nr:hypothetical protein BKA70DRAFT_1530440 [Coprinopsis sp. MPI-PUGE-AT-0042]
MSGKLALLFTVLSPLAFALPISPLHRRIVPQDLSRRHWSSTTLTEFLTPVFGLLGNAAAAQGAGNIADPNCLQQATADQAFTNAKAANDVQGMVDALIYRALERNTLQVGLVSEPCATIQAVNPEIAAIQQHQDSASTGAAEVNKAIVLELAKQIQSVGGDPLDALLSGTFAPGDLNDPTARGNACNEIDDPEGCIFTQNLLVPDASEEEILAAVAGGAAPAPVEQPPAADPVDAACPPQSTVTVTAAPAPVATEAPQAPAAPAAPAPAAGNLQKFNGNLGGQAAPSVTAGGRGFIVEGNDQFLNLAAAVGRSCDVQKNKCANVANSAQGRSAGLSVGQCDQQNAACRAANA